MRFILLLVAAVIAVVAGVSALKLFGGNEQNTAQPVMQQQSPGQANNISTVEVIVAREQIPIGTAIKESMIAKQPWPSHLVLESFVIAGSADGNVVGQVARSTFLPQEPLIKSRLGNPNDPSFLAATLPEGVRAVTLATDAISGVAGYIFPGDHIDVVVTHNMPADAKANMGVRGGGSAKPVFSEVLIANARVLGVNLRDAGMQESARPNVVPSSITLEVPAAVVQQLRLAEKLGTLSLSLRSLKDADKTAVPAPTTLENVTQVDLNQSGVGGVKIIRGVKADGEYIEGAIPSLKDVQPTLGEEMPAEVANP